MNKVIGITLVSLPFVVIFIIACGIIGVLQTIATFVLSIFIVICMFLGVKLITN